VLSLVLQAQTEPHRHRKLIDLPSRKFPPTLEVSKTIPRISAAAFHRAAALLRLIADDLETHVAAHLAEAELSTSFRSHAPPRSSTGSAGLPFPAAGRLRRSVDSSLLTEPQWAAVATDLTLSARELQIVRKVLDNRTHAALADDLGMSPHTANTHLERLYRKLAVTTRVGLVLRVMAAVLEHVKRVVA
jgi:DNA-binding CsgD family transcriptional regulator